MSPRTAVLVGVLFAGVGLAIILAGMGALPLDTAADVSSPRWVIAAAGLAFLFCGGSVIVGYGVAGGIGPDGDLPADTPFRIRLLQYFFGLGCIGSLAAVATWVAFGAGERRFSSTLAQPFITHSGASSATGGRTAFGIGAVLLWLIFAAYVVTASRRLARARGR